MPAGRSSGGAGRPWDSPTVRVVLASTALAPLGVPLISPALPPIRDAFGLTDATASLVVTAYFVAGMGFSPAVGVAADRVGRRRVLVPSVLVFSLAGGAVGLAPTFPAVLALRVVQGAGAAGVFVTTVTLVGDAFAGVQRNTVLGANAAVLSGARAIYPLIGGTLAAVTWRLPFVVSLVGLPVALFAHRALPLAGGVGAPTGLGALGRAVGAVPVAGAILLYGAALLSEVLLFGALFTALPFALGAGDGVSPAVVGLVVSSGAATSVVVASQNGRLAARVSNERLLAATFAAYAIGLVAAGFAASPVGFALAAVPMGAAAGLALPTVDDGVVDLVPADRRAGALSVRTAVTLLGRATGPVLFAGLAVEGAGYRPVLLGGAVAAVAAVGAALVLAGPAATRSPGA